MNLIEILLPLRDNKGHAFASQTYHRLRDELTSFKAGRPPLTARPIGESREGDTIGHDEIIVFEVTVDEIYHAWWKHHLENLEGVFDQDESSFVLSPSRRVKRLTPTV